VAIRFKKDFLIYAENHDKFKNREDDLLASDIQGASGVVKRFVFGTFCFDFSTKNGA